MDYDAVLAQVLALLQQEQRLSYRVLKLRLQLDDDLLEALKEDLIYAKKLAVDEEGRVLVWTGGALSQSCLWEAKSKNAVLKIQWLVWINLPVFGDLRQSPRNCACGMASASRTK
jgi:hypothetical protein